MLTQERHEEICRIVNDKKAVTVTELVKLLGSSESTVRRDLNYLHDKGKLKKVHGGATSLINNYTTREDTVDEKTLLHMEEKERIGLYAASLIEPGELIYIDAGTTTGCLVSNIKDKDCIYVTNGISHAKLLGQMGCRVFVIPGTIRGCTEAIIGGEANDYLMRYNFTKGFFGVNGISLENGLTTPDPDEARTKTAAMSRCKQCYVLADSSKFRIVTAVTFAQPEDARIITTTLEEKQFKLKTEIVEVDQYDLYSHI